MTDAAVKRIFLLRHGAIQGTNQGAGRKRYIGQIDLPLSAEGIEQAGEWHRAFQNRLPEHIFCSDLERSKRFANLIAGDASGSIRVMPELREISLGRWEGIAMREIREKYPEAWKKRGAAPASFRPPGGESFSDLTRRVTPVFHQLCDTIDGNALIVAHAGVNRVILASIMKVDLSKIFQIPQTYAHGNLIEIDKKAKRLLRVNFSATDFRIGIVTALSVMDA